MTQKQFKFIHNSVARNLKTPICDNGQSLTLGEVLDKMNELSNEKEQLQEENKILLGFITEILDFIEDNNGVSLDKMKQFWKSKEKELKE